MDKSLLTHIEATVGSEKATISADDHNIVAIAQEAIRSGRSASFYLSPDQANAVRSWYWTPERVKASGIKTISSEEKERIESELGIENIETFRCSRTQCECGQFYGAFEFLQQGIREHGEEAVKAIFKLANSTFLRANPSLVVVCPNCKQLLGGGIEYDCDRYGGCCYQESVVQVARDYT
ncbi:hypothetical protein AB0M80_14410 [Amycolatopsis sp. NPDC051045]|uniref:hypothetical protein n=1 Tax=Amycolatopsis sp. NPDC051045 TaxID=3156922 RepID=UPI0034409E30